MNILKQLPISFKGELHNIQLINFSIDADEVESFIPEEIKIRLINGRAMMSMVNVELRKMHPTFLPSQIQFNYRHIAFRLLVDDSKLNEGKCKGVFFFRAFTNKPLIVCGGRMITDYNLEGASFHPEENCFSMRSKESFLSYEVNKQLPPPELGDLKQTIETIDRAYSVLNGKLRMIQIQREKWPIEPVHCLKFETNFFTTAKFEGAFIVKETILYRWLPPQFINHYMQ